VGAGGDDPLATARAAAVERGFAFLLAQQPGMGPEWALSVSTYLEPLAADAEVAARLRAQGAAAARVPIAPLPASFDEPGLLALPTLRPLLGELLRRKRIGEPWEPAAHGVERLLQRDSVAFWRAVPLGQQAQLLHAFEALGIAPGRTLDDLKVRLRRLWRQSDRRSLLDDADFMLGVTHVLYTASDYLRRAPDPAHFPPEREILRRALVRYLEEPPPAEAIFLDLQAEVLVGLRLLRESDAPPLRAMQRRLVALQRDDGGWGDGDAPSRWHATLVAVQALADYPPELSGS
jgi:hypothetical protein